MFPVRFRHLSGEASFKRWDIVEFDYSLPASDERTESCRVHEESIKIAGRTSERERVQLLAPMFHDSAKHAAEQGHSLTIVRPEDTEFKFKKRTESQIQLLRDAFEHSARQTSLFDKELKSLEPSPYDFRFEFSDGSGRHNYACGDWEVHAMYWKATKRMGEEKALKWMKETFNKDYPKTGMAFALGNMASRPQTWQLLGVIRLDTTAQSEMDL